MAGPIELKYRGFISYSHADTKWAKWLHGRLESFRIDKDLVGRKTALGAVPSSMRPVFRDRDEFTAGHSLTEQTLEALSNSAAVVAICSPEAAKSRYVNEEIRLFKLHHPDRPVLPLIVDGEPGDESRECFPDALKFKLDAKGQVTAEPEELLAADVREKGDGKQLALAKVIAGLLGVSSDDIYRRAERARRRRARLRGGIAAAFLALAVLAGAFAIFDHQKRQTLDDIEAIVAKYSVISTAHAAVPGARQSLTDAITSIAQGAAQDPRYAQALELLKEGKPTEAEPLLAAVFEDKKKLATRQSKDAAAAARNLAAIASISDLKKARQYYAEAVALDPDNLDGLLQYAFGEILGGSLDKAESVLRQALILSEERNDDASLLRAHWGLGMLRLARDDLQTALVELATAEEIAQRNVAADPDSTEWQRQLAMARNGIGNALERQGKLDDAMEAFRESLAIYERLGKTDPNNAVWDKDKASSYQTIGNLLLRKGNLPETLEWYQKSLAIADRHLAADPDNVLWNFNKAVALKAIGDVSKAQGNTLLALEAYRDNLVIHKRQAEADPSSIVWQLGLTSGLTALGDILVSMKKYDVALQSYRESVLINERQVEADPNTAAWQLGLVWGYVKIADVLLKQGQSDEALSLYRESLDGFKGLAEADPTNPDRRSNIALVHERISDARKEQGRLEDALESQRAAVDVWEQLAGAHPDNTGLQRGLGVSYGRTGNFLVDLDRPAEAEESFSARLAIAERLAALDPSNRLWQSDLAISLGRVAEVRSEKGDKAKALDGFRKARDILARLKRESPGDGSLPNVGWYQEQIDKIEATDPAAPEDVH